MLLSKSISLIEIGDFIAKNILWFAIPIDIIIIVAITIVVIKYKKGKKKGGKKKSERKR